ncbi:ROP-interactive CRIB motif-containing protein 4 [Prunus dulcis]|uniref:ROP-interactive CRIB motif-containing protein 4 n=1 Tax=Prunus dulcis TaxID=3755 RepID=A0A4Y1QNU0_PRUDU|nr:ROP-interactive CRIB motif-containing protein 4 [Prunus dulcis]
MKDRMERFAVLPFGIGCTSQSSVAIGTSDDQTRKSKAETQNPPPHEDDGKAQGAKVKNTYRFLNLRKSHISSGFERLIRSIKIYKEEIEEEEEREMEIGLPTDVKHVTHIGLDGSTTTNTNGSMKGSWENFNNAPEILSFPSISLKQFEFAMAAQTTHQPQPLLVDDPKTPTDVN